MGEVIAAIDAQILQMRRIIEDARNAIEALNSLKERKEMIASVGGGILVRADYAGEVLVDVGGGIVVSKSIDDAIERLERRIKRAEEEIKRLQEERERILKEARGQG